MDKRVEIISTVARRRRWTIEEKVAILEEALQPRASITAVADRHGISRNLIHLWRRQASEIRTLRSTWRGLETWQGRDAVTLADERA